MVCSKVVIVLQHWQTKTVSTCVCYRVASRCIIWDITFVAESKRRLRLKAQHRHDVQASGKNELIIQHVLFCCDTNTEYCCAMAHPHSESTQHNEH